MLGQRGAFRQDVVQCRGVALGPVIGNTHRTVVFQIIIPVEFFAPVPFAGQFGGVLRNLAFFLLNGLNVLFDFRAYFLGAGLVRRRLFQQGFSSISWLIVSTSS